jgi:hypothetical protein
MKNIFQNSLLKNGQLLNDYKRMGTMNYKR